MNTYGWGALVGSGFESIGLSSVSAADIGAIANIAVTTMGSIATGFISGIIGSCQN